MSSIFNFDTFIHILTIIAIVASALSGVLQAARSELDVFGALVLALVCAVGGGTVRDLFIGASPVFWVTDISYLAIVLPTSLLAIILVGYIPPGRGIRLQLLDLADAGGLALFAVLGTIKALQYQVEPPIAVMMGVITGIVGGIIRDVLTNTPPMVLSRGDLYASAALAGCVVYTVIYPFVTEIIAMSFSMAVIFFLRVGALYWHWHLPKVKFLQPKGK